MWCYWAGVGGVGVGRLVVVLEMAVVIMGWWVVVLVSWWWWVSGGVGGLLVLLLVSCWCWCWWCWWVGPAVGNGAAAAPVSLLEILAQSTFKV